MALPLAGQRIKAADLAAIFPLGVDGSTPYVPTWTQSVVVTKTTVVAQYNKVGRWVDAYFHLSAAGAGTALNAFSVTVPVTAAANASGQVCGEFFLFDASISTIYTGTILLASTTLLNFYVGGTVTAAAGATGGTFTAALAAADQLRGYVRYEAAS